MTTDEIELDGVTHSFITYDTLFCEVDVSPPYFDIISILNTDKGNGAFGAFYNDIQEFCIDNGLKLRFRDVSERFAKHLLGRGGELVVHA